MEYLSTRGSDTGRSFNHVLLNGMASDGGLYIPEDFPLMDQDLISRFQGMSYNQIATQILAQFVGGDIPPDVLGRIIDDTYNLENFKHSAVSPLVQVGPNAWILELFHGPTYSFKDYAMQFLARIFDYVLGQYGQKATIVGATSGDTGSAAIEAFKNCKNIEIFILHPKGRTSDIQRKQMTTVEADNVHNIALKGNFDDCQAIVKQLFADKDVRDKIQISAVNSINWARVMAQTVYYVVASLALGGPGRPVSFAVPTGNFGNVYAGWIARQLGLPIEKLVIGTNTNDIITRFFDTGRMEAREVSKTLSPSMDIQVSSNFERYLFNLIRRDHGSLQMLMDSFRRTKSFKLGDGFMYMARNEFVAHSCTDEETTEMIQAIYETTGQIVDPHTAVGLHAASGGVQADPVTPMIALACAHPAKFPMAVKKAIGIMPSLPPSLGAVLDKKEHMSIIENDYNAVKDFILAESNI